MKARGGSAVLLIAQWARYALQLVGLVITARLLAPSDYGVVTMVGAFTGVAGVIGNFGLSLAAIQAKTLTQDQKSNLFWMNACLGGFTSALVCAAALPIADFYHRPDLTLVTLALSGVFLLNALGVQFAVDLNRRGRWVALAAAEFAGPAAGLATTIAFALLGAGVWALVAAQLAAPAVITTMLIAASRWRPGVPRRHANTRSLFRFGRDTLLVEIMNYITSNFDSIILGKFAGAAALGTYNRAYQVVTLPLQQLAAPLTRAILPRLSEEARVGNFNALLTRCHLLISYVLLAPISLLFAAGGPTASIILGPNWAEVGVLIRALAVGGAFQALGFSYYWAFLAKARTLDLFFSELWPRLIMIIVMFGVVSLGVVAIAWAASLGQFLIWLASTFIYSRRAGVEWRIILRVSVRPVLAFGTAALVGSCLASADAHYIQSMLYGIGGWVATVALSALVPGIRADLRNCAYLVRGRARST